MKMSSLVLLVVLVSGGIIGGIFLGRTVFPENISEEEGTGVLTFSATLGTRTFVPEPNKDVTQITIAANEANGGIMSVHGEYVSFDLEMDTFRITNFLVNGKALYSSITPELGFTLTDDVRLKFDRERIVLTRNGPGGIMQIHADDTDFSGTLSINPGPLDGGDIVVVYNLDPGTTYTGTEPILIGDKLIFSGVFTGSESTNSNEPGIAILLSFDPGTSRWRIPREGAGVETQLDNRPEGQAVVKKVSGQFIPRFESQATTGTLSVTKIELKNGVLLMEGQNAVPGATILVNSIAMGVADAGGRFKIQRANFATGVCELAVTDGRTTVSVAIPGCGGAAAPQQGLQISTFTALAPPSPLPAGVPPNAGGRAQLEVQVGVKERLKLDIEDVEVIGVAADPEFCRGFYEAVILKDGVEVPMPAFAGFIVACQVAGNPQGATAGQLNFDQKLNAGDPALDPRGALLRIHQVDPVRDPITGVAIAGLLGEPFVIEARGIAVLEGILK